MGRKKKEVNEKVIEPKVEPKKEPLEFLAWFKGLDEDGDKTKFKFESEGQDLEEAVNNLKFPKGINTVVNIEVKRGNKVAKAAVAPHDARSILEEKQWGRLGQSFREV